MTRPQSGVRVWRQDAASGAPAWQAFRQNTQRLAPGSSIPVLLPHTLAVAARSSQFMLPSGGTADLTATATDSWGESIASWSWSDGGAGGSFSSPGAQNPTYTAPTNATADDLPIVLSVTAASGGSSSISATGVTLVTVEPGVSMPTPIPEVAHTAWSSEILPPYWKGLSANPVDGSCWVTIQGQWIDSSCTGGQVLLLAADGTVLWSTTSFPDPVSICTDPADGSCWVGDVSTGEVAHLARDGTQLWREGGFGGAYGLSVDPVDGSCWVAASSGVFHLAQDGTQLWAASTGAAFVEPFSVSANPADGSCWVADLGPPTGVSYVLGQVVHLAADGTVLWSATGLSLEGPFASAVSVNPADGSCWVGEQTAVVRFAADGTELCRASDIIPYAISVNPADGSCWVADRWIDGVVHLARDGSRLCQESGMHSVFSVTANEADASCWVADVEHIVHLGVSPTLAVTASADPMLVPSSGTTQLAAAATGALAPTVASWSWSDAGAGGAFLPSDSVQSPAYTAPANHTASDLTVPLVVTADCSGGISASAMAVLTVTSPPPVAASFTASPTQGAAPLTVQFTDASTSSPTSWSWTFGDGGTSSVWNPSHTYEGAGAYEVSLTATNGSSSDTATIPRCILVSFPDVPVDAAFWALDQILACVDAGIVTGYPDGSYQPAAPVTRDQMAVYIARALAGGDANVQVPSGVASPTFSDVSASHWAYRYVEYCAGAGIVQGYSGGVYRPDETVNRGQMAVYVARSAATPTGDAGVPDVPAGAPPTFRDVTADNDWAWCYKHVEYCAAAEIVQGYWDGTYRPDQVVTRDQMAVYVARAFELPL